MLRAHRGDLFDFIANGPGPLFADPFVALRKVQRDMNQWLSSEISESATFPALNVWVNEEGAKALIEAQGVEASSLDIVVRGKVLTIKGERKVPQIEGGKLLRRERKSGVFERTIELPFSVNADAVQAQYQNGLLHLTLPRAEADKPKKIALQ